MFVLQLSGKASEIMASELRLGYSSKFKHGGSKSINKKELTATTHGKDLGNHLMEDYKKSLENLVVS